MGEYGTEPWVQFTAEPIVPWWTIGLPGAETRGSIEERTTIRSIKERKSEDRRRTNQRRIVPGARQGLLTRSVNRLAAVVDEHKDLETWALEAPSEDHERRTYLRAERLRIRKVKAILDTETSNVDTALERYSTAADSLDADTPSLNEILEKVSSNIERASATLDKGRVVQTAVARLLGELDEIEKSCTTGGTASSPDLPQLKLAPIPIPKFSGRVWEWDTFWTAFEHSVDSREMDDIYKMNYLLDALHGEAKDTIKQYEVSGRTYPLVVARLKEKYGNSRILIDQLIRRLQQARAHSNRLEHQEKLWEELSSIVAQLQLKGENVDNSFSRTRTKRPLPAANKGTSKRPMQKSATSPKVNVVLSEADKSQDEQIVGRGDSRKQSSMATCGGDSDTTSTTPNRKRQRDPSSSSSTSSSSTEDTGDIPPKKGRASGTLFKELLKQGARTLHLAASKVDQLAPVVKTTPCPQTTERLKHFEDLVKADHVETIKRLKVAEGKLDSLNLKVNVLTTRFETMEKEVKERMNTTGAEKGHTLRLEREMAGINRDQEDRRRHDDEDRRHERGATSERDRRERTKGGRLSYNVREARRSSTTSSNLDMAAAVIVLCVFLYVLLHRKVQREDVVATTYMESIKTVKWHLEDELKAEAKKYMQRQELRATKRRAILSITKTEESERQERQRPDKPKSPVAKASIQSTNCIQKGYDKEKVEQRGKGSRGSELSTILVITKNEDKEEAAQGSPKNEEEARAVEDNFAQEKNEKAQEK
ncbi:hypothetical protein GCK32_002036 [Trichostrongylus colubriformis]|uniref:Uncharacterized protein n=1 Tax=Trichostrongylus colubriformis TaxID=6319 RepID=A0AAN8IAF9_TRICO